MDEKETTRLFLKRIELSESFISASLEKDLCHNDAHYGRADIVFDNENLAIEVKGGRNTYKECIGQAIKYSCAGYRSAIVIPESNLWEPLFNASLRAKVGLITISYDKKLTICHQPVGGWPFEFDERVTPYPKDRVKKPSRSSELIIDESTDWEKRI